MATPTDPEIQARAAHAYAVAQKQWAYLGYAEPVARAILAEFFAMPKPRNPSQKPLNVLSMVGRSRIRAIVEAFGEATPAADAPTADAPEDSERSSD